MAGGQFTDRQPERTVRAISRNTGNYKSHADAGDRIGHIDVCCYS